MLRVATLIVITLSFIVSVLIYIELRKQAKAKKSGCGCGCTGEHQEGDTKETAMLDSFAQELADRVREKLIPATNSASLSTASIKDMFATKPVSALPA